MSKHILLLEDDIQSREGLQKILQQQGYAVSTAGNVEEASAAIGADGVDVAILDLHLPGLPGDQFAIYLRMRCPRARIILISGEYRVLDPERFGRDTVFLPKPLQMPELLSAVAGSDVSAPA